jgi:threonine synthase
MNELGLIKGNEKVVSIVSGSGLKDIKSAIKAAGKANVVEPNLEDVKKIINK